MLLSARALGAPASNMLVAASSAAGREKRTKGRFGIRVENLSVALQADFPMDAARIADARPWQSYIVTLVAPVVVKITGLQVWATMLMAARLPERVSPGAPPLLLQ